MMERLKFILNYLEKVQKEIDEGIYDEVFAKAE